MKIAHIARRLVPEKWGGIEEHLIELASHQQKLSLNPTILTTMALAKQRRESVRQIPIQRFDYFYPYFPLSRTQKNNFDDRSGNPCSLSLYRHLLQTPYNIIHSHTGSRLSAIAAQAAHKKQIPFVITIHGGVFNIPQQEQQNLNSPYQGLFNYGKFIDLLYGFRRDLDRSSGIIVINKTEYQQFQQRYPHKKIVLIPNAIDTTKYTTARDHGFKKRYNIDPHAKLMLIVGRIDPQKNQLALVERFHSIKNNNTQLLLLGPVTNAHYYQQIQSVIAQQDLSQQVHIIPGLEPHHSDLVQAYLNADLFLLPSIHEPFGIVALEAMAAKCPVLANPVGGIPDFITHEQTGFLSSKNNFDDFLSKATQILDSDTSPITRAAFNNIQKNFSWDSTTHKTLNFYNDLS